MANADTPRQAANWHLLNQNQNQSQCDPNPSINGWKPPVIYDWASDKWRIATQEDVDRMRRQVAAAAEFHAAIRNALQALETAQSQDGNRK